ncbi:leucine-rich repeat-containing G-protein coupled receptor 4-like isoform X1 [Diabrotica virgifera virgifera]|uniref:Leucine-rich repeat-containing G-protein coupled receptor 4-like isoform X2 n=1 Tax=Diabrotica virgifera virgifera TaxID=50390 RepID=A0A6P7FJ88_DIAVI|nr:leucine-rich repeat-containing G-protein coupled receptor 4-like isoform X1 [Diabrotica virgifera virgifera]
MIQLTCKLLIFLFVIQGVYSFCENKDAFNNVTVDVHISRNISSIKLVQQDHYSIIDVKQGNITDLCDGMINNFPVLDTLLLINVNLSRIQPNAFQVVPRLRELSLAVNHIEDLVDGSFNNLDALETLYLSANKIKYIDGETFQNMKSLKHLHLDRNLINKLSPNCLRGSSLLSMLDLRHNLMEVVDGSTFPVIEPIFTDPVTIFLGNNYIKDVDPSVFTFKNPVNLHLERNNLNTVSTLFYGMREYSVLYLNKNQFNCLPDDVLENLKKTTKTIYLLDNPISCDCLKTIEKSFADELYGVEHLIYNSSFPCDMPVFLVP